MFLPSIGMSVSLVFESAAENLRFSLRYRYARFDTTDFRSSKAGGSTLVLGTRDTLRADGALEVGDGGTRGWPSLAGLGSHDRCGECIGGDGGNGGRKGR